MERVLPLLLLRLLKLKQPGEAPGAIVPPELLVMLLPVKLPVPFRVPPLLKLPLLVTVPLLVKVPPLLMLRVLPLFTVTEPSLAMVPATFI